MPNGSNLRPVLIAFSLALAAAIAPHAALAQQYSATYNSCHARAKNLVQEGVCDQAELGKQDDRLNKAYKQVMSQYASDPAKQAALRTEERSWLKKRDYDCKINGTTIDDECLMRQTAERADVLEKQVKF